MKIYKIAQFIEKAIPYILLKDGSVERVSNSTHLDYIREKFDLEDDISNQFETTFGEPIDWGNGNDDVWADEIVKDFMADNNIFCVVVDPFNSQVYVRTNLGKRPDRLQMKSLSDWAIENGYKKQIIVDMVIAKQKHFNFKSASAIRLYRSPIYLQHG